MPLSKLAEHYPTTCATEGKMPSTVRGYREKLGRFVRRVEDATLSDFSVELVREYIRYLKSAPKFKNHALHDCNGAHRSAANVQNHPRVLRAF